jgi:hypothetical protein
VIAAGDGLPRQYRVGATFMVNANVMTKVVTAILLNRDTFDGESTCRTAFLFTPTDAQKEAGTKIGRKLFLLHRRILGGACGCSTLGLPDFVFDEWTDATPVEQFKAMRCLLDQCCKGKAANKQLYDELDRAAGELAQRIVQDLAEYEGFLGKLSPARLLSSRWAASGIGSNPAPERRTRIGQYHTPVCIEPEEAVDPAGMDTIADLGEAGDSERR